MKVLMKSDRVPIVLMLIGAAFVIVASLSDHVTDQDYKGFLFPIGFGILVFGFLLWAIPAYLKYQKRKTKKMAKFARSPQDDMDQPRRYARPRR
ncbi:MAG: hypothetical protein ACMUHU_02495 [Thermoplasmatota archaeon]